MLHAPRQWLRALWALALLWQSAAAPAAAVMGCCDEPQPCCVVQAMPSACTACAACAPAAVPMALAGARWLPIAGQTAPGYSTPSVSEAPVDSIWRPPIGALRC